MLYLMRHGQTDWNREYRLQGRTDVPLNDAGREMARLAGQREMLPLDVCYVSPLCRARETAELYLQGRSVPIYPDDRLAEICFGEFEGASHVAETPASPLYALFHAPESYTPTGGAESLDSALRRAEDFLRERVAPDISAGKNVLVVAHGGILCCILSLLYQTPRRRFWENNPKNCQILPISLGITGE